MTRYEIKHAIDSKLKEGRSVVLVGCHGIGKNKFVCETIPETIKIPGRGYLNASRWKREDFYENIVEKGMDFSGLILCIPNLFELKDPFSIINLLFDRRILFLATSDFLAYQDDSDYSSISGRFETINAGSLDYRDWRKENASLSYSNFCLNDYPEYQGDSTLLNIIHHGLARGKRVEEQSQKLMLLMKCILGNGEETFSFRSLSERTKFSPNTIEGYIKKLLGMNLLYSVKRVNLKEKENAKPRFIFYPTFNSFYPFSMNDLAKEKNQKAIYTSKLIGKLFAYNYEVSSGYLYSTKKGLINRYQECGFVLKRNDKILYMFIDSAYDEMKAKPMLCTKDGNPKYYVVLSGQGIQTLDNGIKLIGIDRLIKGDLGEL